MKSQMNMVAAALLAASLVGTYAYAGDPPAPAKRHAAAKKPPKPTVEDQINALRQEFQEQIDGLKSDLAAKDAQVKQAQQAAADAQAAAQKAEVDATAQQQAVTENNSAVSSLQGTVNDLKANSVSLATTVSDEAASIKKQIANPEAIHYKGITISPAGSFLAAETVWRQGGTGGGLNTQFTGVPLDNSEAAQLSEFQGSGRQSRVALRAVGKLDKMTLTGYYEMDWLSSGVTSNNNQSNSYTLRQRQLWADAKTAGGWDFSGGQGWSLATETTQGLTRGTEILPASIDPQYMTGFVWTRQYSFRLSKDIGKKFFMGLAAENAETLNPGGQNLPTNLLLTTVGNTGGLYDNQSNYSYNLSPDLIAKIAVEPGWGHWELFGIARSFRDRIYPTGGTPFNNSVWGGGVGGGFRGPLFNKKVSLGLKGLYGEGVGRYGSSTIADITLRPDGTISPLHGFSSISTLEINPNSRLNLYFNYGGDYIGRDYACVDATGAPVDCTTAGAKEIGYGTYTVDMSGCNTENASSAANASSNPGVPSKCGANTKDVQEFSAGWWYNIYAGPKGRLRQGFQYALFERNLWSGTGGPNNLNGGASGKDNMWWTSLRYYLP
jgi:Skp family chaperone for outer membrane proteins